MFPIVHGVVSQGEGSGGGGEEGGAWSLIGATFVRTLSVAAIETLPRCLTFSPDGTRMYVGGRGAGHALHQYSLSTPWNISTASHVHTKDVSDITEPKGIAISPDGTRILVSMNDIHQYNLSTPWDLSTATLIGDANVNYAPRGLAVSEDGLTVLNVDTSRNVRDVVLASAWTVAGATQGSFTSVSDQDVTPYALAAGASGTRLYMGGQSTDAIYAYDLSTPWSRGTLAYHGESLDISGKETTISGIFVKPAGGSMWIIGPASDSVHEYALTEA